MSQVTSGSIHAFHLFDVAQGIDLGVLGRRLGAEARTARLVDKAPGPSRLGYLQAPVVVDGAAFGCPVIGGFCVQVKCYDYGVISLRLSRPFAGSWTELCALANDLVEGEALDAECAAACRKIVAELSDAMVSPRPALLSEDYLAFVVSGVDGRMVPATELVDERGADIARLLRGERQPLSPQEREEVLRHRLSYLADDLVVAAWNGAFIYDTEAAAQFALEILELANSQLLEFRYYDELLEAELWRGYASLERHRWTDRLAGRRKSRAARRVQAIIMDVNELTDRVENAVKLVGDMYSARLFNLVAARLGLDGWKRNVQEKLKTLDDIYRFAVEQTGMSQANLLELAIVFILVVELGLFFAGIMK